MNPEGFDIDETMHGTLVIRPRADIATPEDQDMKVVLGLIREEKAKGGKFPWWWWWCSVREAIRSGDIPTLDSMLQLGLEKGFR